MSLVYFKRCDRCGKVSDAALVPNPPGWQSLSDLMHGTLAVVDICPECQDAMGIREMLLEKVRNRTVGLLRETIAIAPLVGLPPSVTIDELTDRILAGEFDEALASGDGIDLAQIGAGAPDDEPAEAEIVLDDARVHDGA